MNKSPKIMQNERDAIVANIRAAIAHEFSYLIRKYGNLILYEPLRDCLRIEMTYDLQDMVFTELARHQMMYEGSASYDMKIDGVRIYVVRERITAPGWRLINPLSKGER